MLFAASRAWASGVYITEFCSDTGRNEHYEFVEVTNVSAVPVNMSGWSEDDSTARPDKHSLSGLGILTPGESGIITEASPAAFRTYWGLAASVPVVGNYTNDGLNISADSVTLFDSTRRLLTGWITAPAMEARPTPASAHSPLERLRAARWNRTTTVFGSTPRSATLSDRIALRTPLM